MCGAYLAHTYAWRLPLAHTSHKGVCAGVVRISVRVGYAQPLGRAQGLRAMVLYRGCLSGCRGFKEM